MGRRAAGKEDMAQKWTGKEVAQDLDQKTAAEVSRLIEAGIQPTIGVIRVGEKAADLSYEKGLVKRCEKVGIRVEKFLLPEDVSEQGLRDVVREVNASPQIHGILLFRPLPKGMDEHGILQEIASEKDLDCVTDASLAGVFAGKAGGFAPCTAEAVIRILDYYGYDCTGKRAVVVGRSTVIGKPAAMLLLAKNATVTIAHTRTRDLPALLREADLIVAAAGHPHTVTRECLGMGQTLVDVGINVDENGKLTGDVDREAEETLAGAYTPVPGGVGAVTTSVLAAHLAEAAAAQSAQGGDQKKCQ